MDLTQNETFTRFGKNFQEKLAQLMLEDRPFFDQIMEVLDISFFEKKYIQIFAKVMAKVIVGTKNQGLLDHFLDLFKR